MVYEIGMSVARHGITKLVIVNGHGGNGPALHFAAQMINRDAHIFTCVDTGETSDPDVAEICDAQNDVHAGDIETSTSLAVRPELVRMDRAVKFVPEFSSSLPRLHLAAQRGLVRPDRADLADRSARRPDPGDPGEGRADLGGDDHGASWSWSSPSSG